MATGKLHVVLVPGFFGFGNFGDLGYFAHVAAELSERLSARGIAAEVSSAPVPPTASLRTRSARLAEHLAKSAGPTDEIVIIGHSSGGLDARLVATPSVDLNVEVDLEEIATRIRAVVTLCSPHQGTPMAELFFGIIGQRVLRVLSLFSIAMIRGAGLPLGVIAKVGATLARLRLPGGKSEVLLEALHEELLGIFPKEDKDTISSFISQVGDDQSLVSQITPDAADLFNAGVTRRDTVRYGCVVAAAPKPSWRIQLELPKRPIVQASYLVYRWLSSAMRDRKLVSLELTDAQSRKLEAGFGEAPDFSWSDAIVPTLSQVYGDVLWAGYGDHLDVIGHFDGPELDPSHSDWITSGSGFSGDDFDAMWSRVVAFIAETAVSHSVG